MTTISITAVSVSTRSDQLTSSVPELIQEEIGTISDLLVAEADGHEHQDRQRGRDQQRGAGDDLRRPVADHPAEQPGDRRGEQRQQDDELDGKIHGSSLPQPFIALMSSTSTVPRLRKYTTRIARPIAASAAATVSTSMANTWPVTLPW